MGEKFKLLLSAKPTVPLYRIKIVCGSHLQWENDSMDGLTVAGGYKFILKV